MNSEDIESLLECSICLEQLDETHKVLPCQHTFCRRCLEGVIRKSRKGGSSYLCPECRSEFSTPLEDLPSNIILNRILNSLTSFKKPPSSGGGPLSGSSPEAERPPSLPPKPPRSANRAQAVYRALYDYTPVQNDELELKKSELYIVIEKRKDAWFKGYSISNLKVGFFPGNYVQHVKNEGRMQQLPTTASTTAKQEIDLIDLRETPPPPPFTANPHQNHEVSFLGGVFNTQSTIVPPNTTSPDCIRIPPPPRHAGASSREKVRCIVPFPASGKYELNMEEGDIVLLISKRDDGWCKGTLERTGQVGLFPYSFVKGLTN